MFLPGPWYFWRWLLLTLTIIGAAILYRRAFQAQLQTGAPPSVAALMILAIILAMVSLRAIPTGDEPHYLIMTQSLLRDGDFDLRNNYEHMDYLEYYPGALPDTHVIGVGNRWYPVHGIGLPMLAAPWFALGGRAGVVIMLTLMMVAGLRILWFLMRRAGFDPLATGLAVLVAGFTLPLLSMSVQIFPEVPTFLLVALALRVIVVPALTGWDLSALLLSVALLPWLHSKHMALATALLLSAVLAHRRQQGTLRALAAATGLFFISVGCLVFLSHQWYGVWLPGPSILTAYSRDGEGWLAVTAATANLFAQPWVGLIGVLFDQQSGLFFASPVYVLAIPGIILLWCRERTLAIGCVIVFMSVYLPNGAFGVWYGGFASPARLLTPIVPVLAIGIASMLDAGGSRAWRLFSILAIPSFLHAYLMMAFPRTRYGDPVTQHNFFIARFEWLTHLDLTLLFPSFHNIGLTTWLTTGIYLLAVIVICILLVRQNVAHRAGNPL
jgi:hypothetical protein